jgi:hypothetical protein
MILHDTTRALRRHVLAGVTALIAAPALWAADDAVTFEATDCPASVAEIAHCHAARDANGAWLLAAIPHAANDRLIVHAHGGPRLSAPQDGDSAEDLDRYAAMVEAGYAWIGSTYRRGGYGVRSAAEDVDASRRAFWARWGRPRRTVLHGQSWGGNVAAKLAELGALDVEGRPYYDAVLTTNGLLFGGTRAYGFRADLRAVYQAVCGNHPAAGEPQYPLWQGLPAGAGMSREDLQRRVDACTGIAADPADRTPDQAARLADILAVTGIAEARLVSHLSWATFLFQDLVHQRLQGGNPFDNMDTVYRGSRDDEALNARVQRFAADPAAVAQLAYDADLSGLIVLPTLAVHAAYDQVVSVDALDAYRDIVDGAGRGHLLVPVATDEHDHSRLRAATYRSALRALETWLDTGTAPDAAGLQSTCLTLAAPGDCGFRAP